ncbi:uncharacterized protein METZ01_LOCUS349962 [marine metagenome]|uniref:Uncharacterized protein n=1 Tax=marine metagenome TaxID=408172 RepID=A0A382RJC5_9ZZZZ
MRKAAAILGRVASYDRFGPAYSFRRCRPWPYLRYLLRCVGISIPPRALIFNSCMLRPTSVYSINNSINILNSIIEVLI